MRKYVLENLSALRTHWLAAMSGGFSVPFTVLGVLAGDKYQRIIFLVLAILGFWFALFQVWKSERNKSSVLTARIEDLSAELKNIKEPNLVGKIHQFICGVLVPQGDRPEHQITSLLCNLSIRNLGAPSIADEWRVEVTRDDILRVATLERIPEIPFRFDDGASLTLTRKDAIYDKATSPVPTGGQIRGWLFCTLTGISNVELMSPGTRIVISWEDVTGKRSRAETISQPKQEREFHYFPDGSGGPTYKWPENEPS